MKFREFLLPFFGKCHRLKCVCRSEASRSHLQHFSPPTVRSFPTLPLQTEVIGIADNHCCGMPPRRLSHSNPDVCVCARVNEGTIFETNEGEIERIKEERRQTRTCPDITPCRPETTREFVLVGSARILLSVSEKS